jgi:hypothetical protein
MVIKKGTQITLTEFEQRLAKALAKERNQRSLAATKNQRVDGNRTDLELNIEGVGAEIAYCRMFNCYPDFSTTPRRGGYDCIVNGQTVDVKANAHIGNPYLLASQGKTFQDANIYALMIGSWPTYFFGGWLRACDLLKSENITNFGYANSNPYAVHESKLNPEMEENKIRW